MIDPPSGFEARRVGPYLLLASATDANALLAAALDRPSNWPAPTEGSPGRGALLRRALTDGRRVVLKEMKRGGLLAAPWRQRFPGTRRLLENLTLPLEALRRGVPTARPVALWLLGGPPGLYRGWLASLEIEGAVDLATAFAATTAPGEEPVRAALAAVRRMHDEGVEHPDLNLGNVLVRVASGGAEGFVIDLDRARLHSRALSAAERRTALLRLERSYLKRFDRPPPEQWRRWYAAGDEPLDVALTGTRPGERLSLAVHRLGWSVSRLLRREEHDPATGQSRRGPRPR